MTVTGRVNGADDRLSPRKLSRKRTAVNQLPDGEDEEDVWTTGHISQSGDDLSFSDSESDEHSRRQDDFNETPLQLLAQPFFSEPSSLEKAALFGGAIPSVIAQVNRSKRRCRRRGGTEVVCMSLKQVQQRFILIKSGAMLLCIDQHAADERVKLEALQREVYEGDRPGVHEEELFEPEAVQHLGQTDLHLLSTTRIRDFFFQWRFVYELQDRGLVLLRQVPRLQGSFRLRLQGSFRLEAVHFVRMLKACLHLPV
jgi:DNA mismatch repair ATPase MutL